MLESDILLLPQALLVVAFAHVIRFAVGRSRALSNIASLAASVRPADAMGHCDRAAVGDRTQLAATMRPAEPSGLRSVPAT